MVRYNAHRDLGSDCFVVLNNSNTKFSVLKNIQLLSHIPEYLTAKIYIQPRKVSKMVNYIYTHFKHSMMRSNN